jgi:hypothetical protein
MTPQSVPSELQPGRCTAGFLPPDDDLRARSLAGRRYRPPPWSTLLGATLRQPVRVLRFNFAHRQLDSDNGPPG